MNKHGASRKWFTEADIKDYKSGVLRTTTNITRTGFKLSVSQLRNGIYFFIIAITNKLIVLFLQYKTLYIIQKKT